MFTGEVASTATTAHEIQYPGTLDVLSNSTPTDWHWVPLRRPDEIRLIEIDTSESSDDVIRCRMRTASVEDPCTYYTLSYAWGDTYTDGSHLTHVIDCDGCAFRITKNLSDILVRIRRLWSTQSTDAPLQAQPLWCDAVCINQQNPVERSRQVMLMDRIYKRSTHLYIWMGAEVAVAVDMLVRMTQDKAIPADRQSLVAHVAGSSPWFGRRWVIQEAASQPSASSSILSTSGLLSVQTMRMWLESSDLLRPMDVGPLRERVQAPLLLNMHWHRDARCSDDRDRVFALLNVSSDGGELVVDYTRTAEEVYVAVALLSAKRGLIIPLLILANPYRRSRRRRIDEGADSLLSTWMPDWRDGTPHVEIASYEDDYAFRPALDTVNAWADHPEMADMEHAGGHRVFRDSKDRPNRWRLQLTGWLFQLCRCNASAYSEDCLHCLIQRHSTVVDPAWLLGMRKQQPFVLYYSPILLMLRPSDNDTYELISCTKMPEGQNLAGRINKHWITESGKIRELQDIVLV